MMKNSNVGARGFIPVARLWNKVASKSVTSVLCNKTFPLFLILTLILPLLPSCSDELAYNTDKSENFGEGLTICIPNVRGAAEYNESRAGTFDITPNEGEISDLWLVACDAENTSNTPIVIDLYSLNPNNLKQSDTYEAYTVSPQDLPSGKYNFYVLANITKYLDGSDKETKSSKVWPKITNEETVKNLTLQFANYKSGNSNPLQAGCLPMACIAGEIKVKETGNSFTNPGIITIDTTKEGQAIYADLTFLCAKVRYTILFDESVGDFSGSLIDFTLSGASSGAPKVSKIIDKTTVAYDSNSQPSTYIDGAWDLELKRYNFPINNFPKDSKGDYITLAEYNGNDWTKETKRAWQGIVYLPENLTAPTSLSGNDPSNYASDEQKLSYLTFTAILDGKEKVYQHALKPYDFTNDGYNSTGGIQRGYFYDIVSRVESYTVPTFTSSLEVKPWDTPTLLQELHGPYELVVETTKIDVSSQKPGLLWYYSDVAPEDIRFSYPKITYTEGEVEKKDVNFYIASVYRDTDGEYILTDDENKYYQIELKINPSIPVEVLNKVENGEGIYKKNDFMYFEIIAGNIQKKIEVNPLKLEGFFNVSPYNIIIDVREYITSGTDSKDINILTETNITNSITITNISNGDANLFVSNENNTSGKDIYIVAGSGASGLSSNGFTITDGSGNLKLRLKNFFEESNTWNTEKTINFTIKADDDHSQKVTITIKPYTTDYTIYFRPLDGDWDWPHIYIYQCLELPVSATVTDKYGNSMAGKTVGYYGWSGSEDNSTAALEYCFTNNISFRGWKDFGGTVNITSGQEYSSGFYKMGGAIESSIFNPGNKNNDGRKNVYDYETDLNANHKITSSNNSCYFCQKYSKPLDWNDNYGNHIWPGVTMIKETINEEEWWKYTLSGIATPGKAMIMFANGHEGEHNRYPQHSEVGVPLFDFPSHTGWFVFDGNSSRHDLNFYAEKPNLDDLKQSMIKKFRIYWHNSLGRGLWIGDNTSWKTDFVLTACNSGSSMNNWESCKNIGIEDNSYGEKYYYIEFTTPNSSGDLYIQFSSLDGNDNYNGGKIDNFKNINGVYTGYVDSNGQEIQKGTPGTIEPDIVTDYYLIGGNTSWNWSNDYRFYTTTTKNVYKTKSITVDQSFKITYGESWNKQYQSNGNNLTGEEVNGYTTGTNDNINLKEGLSYTGIVTMKVNSNNVTIWLEDKDL